MNKVILVGRIGHTPLSRRLPSGKMLVTFSIATDRFVKKKDGVFENFSDWHNIVYFDASPQKVENLLKSKGRKVSVVGEIRPRKYKNRQGFDAYVTEIIASEVRIEEKILDNFEDAEHVDDDGSIDFENTFRSL
ncbi:MAG: single-stranded DNA-binding protein [Holosporaceae bacterium]|jgi:single-strand DNA-binding protein|nr:single-stranded DNA-binding protein [Holosporaceae bacterium]